MSTLTVDQDVLVQVRAPAANDLVPSPVQHELLAIRDYDKYSRFRIGDISIELYDQHRKTNPAITKQDVRQAVGYYVGKSSRTVRYYEAVSEFYPQEIREQYGELPFDAFDIAKRYPHWEEILQYAQQTLCSMDTLESKVDSVYIEAALHNTPVTPLDFQVNPDFNAPINPVKVHKTNQIIFSDLGDLVNQVKDILRRRVAEEIQNARAYNDTNRENQLIGTHRSLDNHINNMKLLIDQNKLD